MAGCADRAKEIAHLQVETQEQQRRMAELGREVSDRDSRIHQLEQQLKHVTQGGSSKPLDLFSPVKITIASLSRGADYDGEPGDDGVTVHIRPIDADGNTVPSGGTFRIALMDPSDLENPRTLRVYTFDEPDEIRKAWYGKFLTNHFTFRCPFPETARLTGVDSLDVRVEFIDWLTGRTLTTGRTLPISVYGGSGSSAQADLEPS